MEEIKKLLQSVKQWLFDPQESSADGDAQNTGMAGPPASSVKIPHSEADDDGASAERGNPENRFEKPAGYSEFKLNDLRFYYRRRIRHSTNYKRGPLTLERTISDTLRVYRNKKNEEVLRIHVSIPTFDSGDREWDSYRELYIWPDGGKMCGVLTAGGYRVASVESYTDLRCADARTEELLQSAIQ